MTSSTRRLYVSELENGAAVRKRRLTDLDNAAAFVLASTEGKAAESHGKKSKERGSASPNSDGRQSRPSGGRLPTLSRDRNRHYSSAIAAATSQRIIYKWK